VVTSFHRYAYLSAASITFAWVPFFTTGKICLKSPHKSVGRPPNDSVSCIPGCLAVFGQLPRRLPYESLGLRRL
jgi:hypothetical protein